MTATRADFARIIGSYLEAFGMSRAKLADRLNIDRSTVSKWINEGQIPGDVGTIDTLCKVLKVTDADRITLLEAAGLIVMHNATTLPCKRVDFFRHKGLPVNFVQRPELLAEIKAALLDNKSIAVAVTSGVQTRAVQGMGGIGKTVAVRALCEDTEVQAAFSDGILWASVGKTPDLFARLREWANQLDAVVPGNAPTLNELKNAVSETLQERACLLIADDVWEDDHAEAFRVGGPQCRLVITTRNAHVAEAVGATLCRVPLMSVAEAIELLEKWGSERVKALPWTTKEQIVDDDLGRLALAIRLAGPQLQHRSPEEWRQGFTAKRLKLRQGASHHDSLEATIDLSLEDLEPADRNLYLALTAFIEDEPIPVAALHHLWGEMAGFDSWAVEDMLEDLAKRALLERTADMRGSTVQIHDLVRDLITEELGPDGIDSAHRAMVAAYRRERQSDGWDSVLGDGYILEHLVYHLAEIAAHDWEAWDELGGLFASERWMHIRVQNDQYRYDGFLADLDRAQRVLLRKLNSAGTGEQCSIVGTEYARLSLIRSSILSLSGNYVPAIVMRAIELDYWSDERVLSIASAITDPERRTEMYGILLKTNSSTTAIDRARFGALNAALAIRSEGAKAEALKRIAPNLNPPQKRQALAAALQAALAINDIEARNDAITALVPLLNPPQKRQALTAALDSTLAIEPKWKSITPLLDLAPHLDPPQKQQALATAYQARLPMSSTKESKRTRTIKNLAPYLDSPALAAARQATLTINEERKRTRAIKGLTPYLDPPALVTVITDLTPSLDPPALVTVITDLAPYLDSQALAIVITDLAPYLDSQALATVITDLGPYLDSPALATVLTGLALYLDPEALARALHTALEVLDPWERAYVLTGMAPYLDPPALATALRAARETYLEPASAFAVADLASYLDPPQKQQALAAALESALTTDEKTLRVPALMNLAPYLDPPQKQQALAAALESALTLADEENRALALARLAPYLDSPTLAAVLQAALAIDDEEHRALALTGLAPYLDSPMLAAALQATLAINDEAARSDTIAGLAPHLDPSMLAAALQATLAINTEWNRAIALTGLAPYLDSPAISAALQATLTINDERDRANALICLASHMDTPLKQHALAAALQAALAINNDWNRAKALTGLAPHLDIPQKQRALAAALDTALAIDVEWARTDTLVDLMPHLDPQQKQQALTAAVQAANAIDNGRARDYAFSRISSDSDGLAVGSDIGLLRCFAKDPDRSAFAELLKVDAKILDPSELVFTLTGIAPYLDPPELAITLQVALAINDEWSKAKTITGLAPYLDPSMLADALRAALTIKAEWARAEAITGLAPRLSLPALADALESLLTSPMRPRYPVPAARLVALVNQLPESQPLYTLALTYLLDSFHDATRPSLLHALATPNLIAPPLFDRPAIQRIAESIIEICNEWEWL